MCNDHVHTGRRGASLRDPAAHASDHKAYSRRSFLRTLGLAGAAGAAAATLPVTSLYGFPLAGALNQRFSDRKLVLIRLKGGNDGLNTIVPLYDYDRYRAVRPTLAHADNSLIGLNADFAMPEVMTPLQSLWSGGRMRVLNSVGYPDHSLSHFTGADIIDSGSSDIADNGDGWLARYYTDLNPDYRTAQSPNPPAVKIGGPTSVVFNDAEKIDISANFPTADRLEDLAAAGQLYDAANPPDNCYYGDQVAFLRTVANSASLYGASISDAYNNSTTDVDYTTSLGEQLRLVARLIKGDLRTQLYLVTLDGFDTHVSQNGSGNHLGLLDDLSRAVADFYADLAATNRDGEVVAMTYSEFGRRVEENGVGGTDHGQAMPVMLFGPALGGSGTHGTNPELDDLDANGNLTFGTDFRSLYATMLQEWLCVDADTVNRVLGDDYERLPELGLSCGTVSTQPTGRGYAELRHRVLPLGGAAYALEVELPRAQRFAVDLYTLSGVHVRHVAERLYPAGAHRIPFDLSDLTPHVVPMAYTFRAAGRVRSGKFIAGR